jgi:hypothetical protein
MTKHEEASLWACLASAVLCCKIKHIKLFDNEMMGCVVRKITQLYCNLLLF